jgi:hypothetical protein
MGEMGNGRVPPHGVVAKISQEKPGAYKCQFVHMDFLTAPILRTDFGFVFDMGCFHTFHDDDSRDRFAQKVAASLREQGLWLSICGNSDGPELGPPRRSALEITRAVEDNFEIQYLKATYLDELYTYNCVKERVP